MYVTISYLYEYYKGDNLTYILTHVEIDTKHRIKFFFYLFSMKNVIYSKEKEFSSF